MPPLGSRAGSRTLILTIAIITLSMLLFQTDTVTDDASAIPFHSMRISLFPNELTAKITSTQLGAVTFGGNVTIEMPPGPETVEVTLQADCGRGWPTVQSPQTIEFIDSGTERFSVTVIVPPDTPPVSSTVTVTGHAHSAVWDDTASCEATVSVEQVFNFEIWLDSTREEAEPGGTVGGTLTIFNNGTGEDRFLISLESQPDFVSHVDIEDSVTIPSKFELGVQFTLTIDDDYDPDSGGEMHTLVFRVESEGARNDNLLYAKTEPFYIHFSGWGETLVENWQTYTGYVVGVAILVLVTFIIVRRWRGNRSKPRRPSEDEYPVSDPEF